MVWVLAMEFRHITHLFTSLTSTTFLSTLLHNRQTTSSIVNALWLRMRNACCRFNMNIPSTTTGPVYSYKMIDLKPKQFAALLCDCCEKFSSAWICHPRHCHLNWWTLLWEFFDFIIWVRMFPVYDFPSHHMFARRDSSPPRCPFWCGMLNTETKRRKKAQPQPQRSNKIPKVRGILFLTFLLFLYSSTVWIKTKKTQKTKQDHTHRNT